MRRTVSGLDMGALFGWGGLVSTASLPRASPPIKVRGTRDRRCSPKSELGDGFLCHCGTAAFPAHFAFSWFGVVRAGEMCGVLLLTISDCGVWRCFGVAAFVLV